MSIELLSKYYSQTKQRVDCEMTSKENLKFMTKLTYQLKESFTNDCFNQSKESLCINLHCLNINISKVSIIIDEIEYNSGIVYNFMSNDAFQSYLTKLKNSINTESNFELISRTMFERFNDKGNMNIYFPTKYIIKDIVQNDYSELAGDCLIHNKIKVMIYYSLSSFNQGVLYHQYFNEKFDYNYHIYYTPNYVS